MLIALDKTSTNAQSHLFLTKLFRWTRRLNKNEERTVTFPINRRKLLKTTHAANKNTPDTPLFPSTGKQNQLCSPQSTSFLIPTRTQNYHQAVVISPKTSCSANLNNQQTLFKHDPTEVEENRSWTEAQTSLKPGQLRILSALIQPRSLEPICSNS